MSKIYTIAFRMGVLFNVLLWTVLNVINYKIAENDYIERQSEIRFSGIDRVGSWGFPFDWDAKCSVIEGAGAILNIIIMTVCGFAFGFLFKFFLRQPK